MKRIRVIEEETFFSELIAECEDKDIDIKDILSAIDTKFENYKTNVELINVSIKLLLDCSPFKDDCKDIDIDNLKKLLNILEK